MDIVVEWEETHEFKTSWSVDEAAVRKWLIESGPSYADKEIDGDVIKEFLNAGDDFQPEGEDYTRGFQDAYGHTITMVTLA